MEMAQRKVSQAANTPRLTQLPLRETSPVLMSALSLVLMKNAFFNPPARSCKRQATILATQELPEHADDSNPVQDDFHGFLPEHAVASHKIRDKRTRKTRTKTVPIRHPTQKPQTPASAMEDY
ncbi:hypothetical protein ACTXT7_017580 [Hymenolepis weldensis]